MTKPMELPTDLVADLVTDLATGSQLRGVRERLGLSKKPLADYWGLGASRGRERIGKWEAVGDALLPQPRILAILLRSMARGWYPAEAVTLPTNLPRRQPVASVPGAAVCDALELMEITPDQLAAYWGVSRASIYKLQQYETLPRSASWDIVLDDLLSTCRIDVLRWSEQPADQPVVRRPRGRHARRANKGGDLCK